MKKLSQYVLYYHLTKGGEVFYVGIGNKKRPYSTNHRSKFWWNIVNKSGLNIVIVEENLSWELAQERERYWIKHYGRRDIGTGILVNLTDGGDGMSGSKWAEDRVEKASKMYSGIGNPFYGKKHSEAAIAKIVIHHTGLKQSEETTQKRSIALTGIGRPESVKRAISKAHKIKNASLIIVQTSKDISKIRSKLSEKDVKDIRILSENLSYRSLSEKYNMAVSAISKIVNKQSFSHI